MKNRRSHLAAASLYFMVFMNKNLSWPFQTCLCSRTDRNHGNTCRFSTSTSLTLNAQPFLSSVFNSLLISFSLMVLKCQQKRQTGDVPQRNRSGTGNHQQNSFHSHSSTDSSCCSKTGRWEQTTTRPTRCYGVQNKQSKKEKVHLQSPSSPPSSRPSLDEGGPQLLTDPPIPLLQTDDMCAQRQNTSMIHLYVYYKSKQ